MPVILSSIKVLEPHLCLIQRTLIAMCTTSDVGVTGEATGPLECSLTHQSLNQRALCAVQCSMMNLLWR